MNAQNYKMYQTCSDKEMIKIILEGDTNALYYLVRVRYQKEIYGVIVKCLKRSNKCADMDLEYWLYRFCDNMSVPTKIKKKSKFENIENKENIKSWLCRCCRHFLINDEEFVTSTTHDFDFNWLLIPNDLESRTEHTQTITGNFIWTIELFNKRLTAREKYVVFTYLYCEKKQVDELLYLDKKIARVLKTSDGNVRKIKSVAYDKIRNFLIKDVADFS